MNELIGGRLSIFATRDDLDKSKKQIKKSTEIEITENRSAYANIHLKKRIHVPERF